MYSTPYFRSSEQLDEVSCHIMPTGSTISSDEVESLPRSSSSRISLAVLDDHYCGDHLEEMEMEPWPSTPEITDNDDNLTYIDHIEHVKQALLQETAVSQTLSPGLKLCVRYVQKELVELQFERNRIFRRQYHLMYMLEDLLMQEECERLRNEVNNLIEIPEDNRTSAHLEEEKRLIQQIINIVAKRSSMLEEFHKDKIRELEEDTELEKRHFFHTQEWNKAVHRIGNAAKIKILEETICRPDNEKFKVKISKVFKSCNIL